MIDILKLVQWNNENEGIGSLPLSFFLISNPSTIFIYSICYSAQNCTTDHEFKSYLIDKNNKQNHNKNKNKSGFWSFLTDKVILSTGISTDSGVPSIFIVTVNFTVSVSPVGVWSVF